MEKVIICPNCKSNYEIEPPTCSTCGFPFNGTDNEKSLFIAQQILKRGKISDASDQIKKARIILWFIGGFLILVSFLNLIKNPMREIYIFGVLFFLGLLFIGFGFLTYKKPIISILIPLIMLLLFYTMEEIAEPNTLFQGILVKFFFLFGLLYSLVSVIKAQQIRKESDYLKEQKYK